MPSYKRTCVISMRKKNDIFGLGHKYLNACLAWAGLGYCSVGRGSGSDRKMRPDPHSNLIHVTLKNIVHCSFFVVVVVVVVSVFGLWGRLGGKNPYPLVKSPEWPVSQVVILCRTRSG